MTNTQQSLETEANQSHLHNKSGNSLINNLKASKNTITDLKRVQDGDTIFFQDDAFIFVITLSTKQRLEVNLELGFVANIHPGLHSKNFLV